MSELTRLAEWTVAEDEIDHLGHMNIQFYARRADQGCAALLATLGLGAADLDAAALTAVAVDQHTMYRREQLVHSPLAMSGGIVAADTDNITVYQEMHNVVTGDLAATFLFVLQLKDRAVRTSAPVPDAAVKIATASLVEAPARGQPRSLPLERMGAQLTIDDFARAGIESHMRREIGAEDCNEYGFLTVGRPRRFPLGATPPWGGQGVMDNVWGSVEGFAWPALEARTLTLHSARVGDVLDSYAALLSVSHRVIHSGTWTFDAASRRLMSVSQQVNIFFDLTARHIHDIPGDVHAHIAALANPELLPKRR